jgi:hypothetical protein
MQQATPHSLHIAQATDWKEAVITLLERRSPYRPWRYGPSEAREGDTVAFVLNTDPASIVTAVAKVGPDGNPRSAVFDRPMSDLTVVDLTTLAATVGLDLDIARSWQFDEADAAKLEGALHECRYLFAPENRFGHSSVCEARTLLRFRSWCAGCERDFDLTRPDACDQIFVHTIDQYFRPGAEASRSRDRDWPAVICRQCRKDMEDGGYHSFVAFKFALHPACPECGARRTRATFYGMPADHLNIPPWSVAGGCCPSDERWNCDACDHEW